MTTDSFTGERQTFGLVDGKLEVAAKDNRPARGSALVNAVMVAAVLGLGGTTTNVHDPPAPVVRDSKDDLSTSSYVWGALRSSTAVPTSGQMTLSQAVRTLYERSGLTWEQLARLFGVSRQAIHNWANGGRMTTRHIETLGELARAVNALDADSPEARRAIFLAPHAGIGSLYDEFRATVSRRMRRLNDSALSPGQLLGGTLDD